MQVVHRASRWLVAVLVVALVACGGGGGGGSSSAPPAVAASKIFVGDNGHGAIGSSPNSNPSAGTGVVDRIISGGSTFLTASVFGVRDFALDATNDRLFVVDSNRILAFDNVGTASGNVAPRVVATATGGDIFSGIYLDTANSQVYAATRLNVPGNDEIRVYSSTATNGAAIRAFSCTCQFAFDVAIDIARDVAYVYYTTSSVAHIGVFDAQSTLNGPQAPSRTIDFIGGPTSVVPIGIFLDAANDRLYVPNVTGGVNGTVEVYDAAHTASGTGTQSRTITLVGVSSYSNVFVETSANRLYVADPLGVTIAANASTTTSTLGGVRILPPSGSQFTAVAVKP